MFIISHIEKNTFRDSVYLMRLSSMVRSLEGVEGAEVIMGTDHNKKFLESGGLLTAEIEKEASANDLVIAVKARDKKLAEEAVEKALEELNKEAERGRLRGEFMPRTFETALKQLPGANLALISIPGQYVEREAHKILDAGLHVMIFSDNVPLEAEVALKKKAVEKGLLLMGPDCGTAIINGVPLAFANDIRKGNIGLVAAAGTGLQEVSSIIHNLGAGVSQAIGTGGRDIKASVGGLMMLQGFQALADDPETEVIVLISKPPDSQVTDKILQQLSKSNKPVVVCFVGADLEEIKKAGCHVAATLKEAAEKAVLLSRGEDVKPTEYEVSSMQAVLSEHKSKLTGKQRYLRGLYSGGTLAYESLVILNEHLGGLYSNIALKPEYKLKDSWKSYKHTIVDLGEDEFTEGRPHPMIDPTLRQQRLLEEAKDPETAVIMMDIVLGYNAHPDPAGALLEAIVKAKKNASLEGRQLVFVATVCGTDSDLQKRQEQVDKLKEEGVLVFSSNADAAFFVKELLSEQKRR